MPASVQIITLDHIVDFVEGRLSKEDEEQLAEFVRTDSRAAAAVKAVKESKKKMSRILDGKTATAH